VSNGCPLQKTRNVSYSDIPGARIVEPLEIITHAPNRRLSKYQNTTTQFWGGVLKWTTLRMIGSMSKPQEKKSFFRMWAMRQYWRMQQSQAIVSLLLWGTTITLLVWPLISWRFSPSCNSELCFSENIAGIPSAYIGLTVIFLSVMFAVLSIGFLYDQVFSLWTEWRNVDMERNPFATYALAPVWVIVIALQAESLKRNSSQDDKIIEQADWCLRWCELYTEGEMFARAVQRWDKDLGETPTFWFTSDEAMQRAREVIISDGI